MKKILFSSISAIVTLIAMNACQNTNTESPTPVVVNSFDLIQDRILTPTCATSGCHASEQDGSFKQHGLVLAKGVSYNNLINKDPKNGNALADKLKLVLPFYANSSLFYHKLVWDGSTHHSGKSYGSPMPLGSNALYKGQIEFIRRWIDAGAPRQGNVADTTLLADRTASYTAPFTPLEKPKAGEGIQLTMGPFEVAPNFEREIFQRQNVGNTEELYANRVSIRMRPGSHHFIFYGFRDPTNFLMPAVNQMRDLRNTDGTYNLLTVASMSNHVFWVGAQSPNHDYTFPEGMALRLPANISFDANSHYVNKGTTPLTGEVYANLYTVPKEKVTQPLNVLDLGNQDLNLLPKAKTTVTKTFIFDKPRTIVALTSHMHKLGEKFVIKIAGGKRNGEVVYETNDWEHPIIKNFDVPIALNKGEGLTSEITYNNTTAKTVRFGLTSDDEMGIIFGYFFQPL